MPRVYYMKPGQSMMVGGIARIDLLESTNDEWVLLTIMASPALPIVSPFETSNADMKYKRFYEQGNVLRVPYSKHIRDGALPELAPKTYEIECVGNHMSTSDIVFSTFGWTAVTSRPNVRAKIRAFTLGGEGLELRQPSLLPYVVNIRKRHQHKDKNQSFITVYYRRPSSR